MRVPNIYKIAFFALIFCLLNIFTVVMSNDIEKAAANLGSSEEYSSLHERNETGIYENPLHNNNHTTGFIVNSSTVIPLGNAVKNLTLADPIDVFAEFRTNRPKKNSTAQSYENDESEVYFNITVNKNASLSVSLEDTSKTSNIEAIENSFSNCCSKSLLFQYQNLQNTSIGKLNKSNQSDFNSLLDETLTLAEDIFEENSKLYENKFQAFKETLCEQAIERAKKSILMKLNRQLDEIIEYYRSNDENKSEYASTNFYLLREIVFPDLDEEGTIVLPEAIQTICNNKNFDFHTEIVLTHSAFNIKIMQKFLKVYEYVLKYNEFGPYDNFLLQTEKAELVQIIREKEQELRK